MVLSQPPEFSLGSVKGYIANYTAVIFVAVTSVVSISLWQIWRI
jgi:hypothetical protein